MPCLNEARHVGSVVQQALTHLPVVIVVDDGSADDTSGYASRAGATVIRHGLNRGKGAALSTGLSAAMQSNFLWALVMDGDGQHSPTDIPAFLRCAELTGASLIVGDRMQQPSAMPPLRRFVNRWMSRRISARIGRDLSDTQCGFRLIDLRVWSSLVFTSKRFEVESEMLLSFLRAGQRVEFVAVKVIYKDERSKIEPISDTIRWFRWWCKALKPTAAPCHQKFVSQ
jgi:glycosyltransferase involved in cell wall biosynthesis